MDTYWIITNEKKDQEFQVTEKIIRCIEGNKDRAEVFLTDVTGKVDLPKTAQKIKCVLTVGGDGTYIVAARSLIGRGIPILGINRGTLGYLTEVDVQNIDEAISQVRRNAFMTEERMMLEGILPGGQKDVALNDIVVTRHGPVKILSFNVYVNHEILNTYEADGMIISTPTGSTAYNLSAGGPIVEPTASMIVITPICSHALNTRSIVLSADDLIEVEIGEGRGYGNEMAEIAFDGADIAYLKTGDKIAISRAELTTKLLKLSKVSFLETLREKMKGN